MARRPLLDFTHGELGAAGLIALAAVAGLAVAASPWRADAAAWLTQEVPVRLWGWSKTLPLRVWTRDGLMTLFFFGLGLELKVELVRGELSSLRRLAMPGLAAIGGLVAASVVYATLFRASGAVGWSDWPAVLGADTTLVLAAVGLTRAAPTALRSFALTIALVDNLVLVIVLALRRGVGVDAEALAAAAAVLSFLALLSRWRAAPLTLFAAGAVALWATTLRAGVDPSAAGLAAALMLPMRARRTGERDLVERTRRALHPLLAYAVAPAFVFCAVAPQVEAAVTAPSTSASSGWVVAAALLGKSIGAIVVCTCVARAGWARRPNGLSWRDIAAASLASSASLTCGLYALTASKTQGGVSPNATAAVLLASLGLFAGAAGLRLQGASRPTRPH